MPSQPIISSKQYSHAVQMRWIVLHENGELGARIQLVLTTRMEREKANPTVGHQRPSLMLCLNDTLYELFMRWFAYSGAGLAIEESVN